MNEYYLEEQLAGIANMVFYLLTEVSNWPIQLTDTNAGQLVFAPATQSAVATVDEESFADESKIKDSNSGEVYENSLKYNIITRGKQLEQLLDTYKNKPGIALVRYYDGSVKLFGTNEEPLFMKFTPKNGSVITDKAFVTVEIQGTTRNRPVYYSL